MLNYLRTLFRYRELVYFLALREIKAKYKQTVLGVAWSVLQPVCMMTVFTVVFSYFVKVPSDGVPYPVFAYCALLPWQFFAGVLGRGVGSLLSNQNLVKKVYFPREIIPLAITVSAIVDFAIGCGVFVGLLWFYKVPLGLYSLAILPIFMIEVILVVGLILVLSPMNVFYRDVTHVIPLLIQVWMYATPVVYASAAVPAPLPPAGG